MLFKYFWILCFKLSFYFNFLIYVYISREDGDDKMHQLLKKKSVANMAEPPPATASSADIDAVSMSREIHMVELPPGVSNHKA